MSGKKKQKHDPDVLVVQGRKDQDEAEAIAEAALRPEFQATVTVREYVKTFGNISMTGLVTAMQETLAATEKVTLVPGRTAELPGWPMMRGGVVTCKLTGTLKVDPAAFRTTTV